MALSLTPSSAESCFGVIGSVIFRTIISSANVGPINPLTRRNPRQLQRASYRREPANTCQAAARGEKPTGIAERCGVTLESPAVQHHWGCETGRPPPDVALAAARTHSARTNRQALPERPMTCLAT